MKLLRNLLWPVLLPLIAAATAHAIVIFGTPIPKAKTEDKSTGIFASNNVVFELTGSSWSNIFIHFTTFTNYPAGWTNAYYMYATVVPAGGTWQVLATTNYDNFWHGDMSLWGHYNEGSNSTSSFMFTIKALSLFDSNGIPSAEVNWYPTNIIGQNQVAPTNWVQSFGGAGVDGGSAVAVDTNGNTYVAGYFSGTASILGTNLTATGAQNMFLAKVNQNGGLQWAKRYGLGSESPVQMVLNHAGELCLIGGCNGATDLSGATTTNGVNYITNGSLWVAKYNTSGVLQWSKSFQASSVGGIAVDSTDNIYAVGVVGGGGGVTICGATFYPFSLDTYLMKLSTSGTCVWDKEANCAGDTIPGYVSVDSNDDIFVTGGFKSTINWGSGTTNATYSLGYALYLAKFNTSGTCAWTDVFGNGYNGVSPLAIASDNGQNVYIGGRFYSTCNFGLGTLSAYPGTSYAPFLCKYNSVGTPQWTQAFQGPSPTYSAPAVTALSVDSDTNVWASGIFTISMTMGTNTVTSIGGQSVFVGKFSSNGTNTWVYSGGGPYYTFAAPTGIAIDTTGSMRLTGSYYQTATFGSTTLNSLGGYDGFVIRQHP